MSMIEKSMSYLLCAFLSLLSTLGMAQNNQALEGLDGFGQIIRIQTNLHSFVGRPIWTFIVRDIDHNITMPHIFDITKGHQTWIVFTHSRNYLIEASRLQIETYQPRYNEYKNYRINNFCSLESNGRIMRGKSLNIHIKGDLSPFSNTYSCSLSSYQNN